MSIRKVYDFLRANDVAILEGASKYTRPGTDTHYSLIKGQDIGRVFNLSNPSLFLRNLAKCDRESKFIEMCPGVDYRRAMYIAEPLFYKFLLYIQHPSCEQLQAWVLDEVLPQIAEDDSYTKSKGILENV